MRISLPLIACLLATVIPVFFGKLSVTPTWLSLQALALGWITLNKNEALDFHALEAGLEILFIRAWLVPHLLRRTLLSTREAELDVMPSNLFAWGAQLVALLYMENALALFESLMPEPWPLPVHVAVSGVYVGTVVVGSWLIRSRHSSSLLAAQSREDGR